MHTFKSRIWVLNHNLAIFLRKLKKSGRYIIGAYWTDFCSQKLKKRKLATFGFNRTELHFTQRRILSMICTGFWRTHYQPQSRYRFVDLGAAIWHRWIYICGVPSMTKNFFYPIDDIVSSIMLHIIDNDQIMTSRGSHLNQISFYYYTEGLYFQIKLQFWENIQKLVLAFSKKLFGGPCTLEFTGGIAKNGSKSLADDTLKTNFLK